MNQNERFLNEHLNQEVKHSLETYEPKIWTEVGIEECSGIYDN